MIRRAFGDLDRVLRGEKTQLKDLRDGTVDVSFPGLTSVVAILGAVSGLCMGVFALFRDPPVWQQTLASAVKVPLLFLLTLIITFPSLYVFNALVGSRLRLVALSRLLIASLGVTVSVTAAFGTIIAFFSVSTTSYPFMVLLNVAVFAVAGLLGLHFLLQTLHRITTLNQPETTDPDNPASQMPPEPAGEAQPKDQATRAFAPGPLEPLNGLVLAGHVKAVFRCWIIVFALVGAQMSWVLRPFIGSPNSPFAWFRERKSNFFEAVMNAMGNLF